MQKILGKKKQYIELWIYGFKNGRLNYKCKECRKSYTKLTGEATKIFPTLHKFCNGNLDKFFVL